MSPLLQARNVRFQVGATNLFDALNLAINGGDRVGLVGHNGSGKSTLLQLLSLAQAPDSGEVVVRRGLRIAQVAQFLPESMQPLTLRQALLAQMSEPEDWRADSLLAQFAFLPEEGAQTVGSLSGGQQNRLMFAQALAEEPELLLLDEPTNHLDLATMVLFEQRLQDFSGACVLVSHDRAFLDAVTNSTAFLRDRQLASFASSYSPARLALAEADEAAARRAQAETKEIEALRASAKRLATWGKVYDSEKMSRRAKNMDKRVQRLEDERTELTAGSPLDLSLSLAGSRARQMLAIDSLRVRVPGRELFQIQDLVIRPGERVALLGHNGVGKSTLVRLLVAACGTEDPEIRISPQARLGYYDQELDEVAGEVSMIAFVRQRTDLDEQALRQRLINAGFAYADHDKRVSVLSGGERARLLFLVLSAAAPNFLILDEPTNHIDIDGKEQLEAQLLASAATVLITSHDRRFLETVAIRYLLIDNGRMRTVNDPQAFFASRPEPSGGVGNEPVVASSTTSAKAQPQTTDADAIVAQIESLEALVSADLARKPKFQKPDRRVQWEAELRALYQQLEAL